MEEIRSNSNKSKTKALPEKRAEKIISGEAKLKKKSELRKFADIFVPEDVDDITEYIKETVIIPATKKAIRDIVDLLLYGSVGAPDRKKTPGERFAYNNCFGNRGQYREENPRKIREVFEYDDLWFATRGEAEAILEGMDEIMDSYGQVRVMDMFDLAGVTPPFTANDYGWRDIRSAKIIRIGDGYAIKMPRAVPID